MKVGARKKLRLTETKRVRVSEEMDAALQELAVAKQRTEADLLREAVREYLERNTVETD